MIIKKYQSYLCSLFIKKFIIISFVFLCLVIIVNFFEEIRFSEKYNAEIYYTIYLSFLNAPSLIYEIFPFILVYLTYLVYCMIIDIYCSIVKNLTIYKLL